MKNLRLLRATDIHINFCDYDTIKEFCKNILSQKPDLLIITGDITEAQHLTVDLRLLQHELKPLPVFFILGNHDYYNGSVMSVQRLMEKFKYPENEKTAYSFKEGIWYLGNSGIIPITDSTALIGADGWYDGQYANWFSPSVVQMSDYYCISELNAERYNQQALYNKLQELAQRSTDYIEKHLNEAFANGYTKVFVATHIPPFKQNSVYRGKISNDNWLPNFSSKIMGDMLLKVMSANPNSSCIVLCGHSHGEAYYKPLPNLECYTGEAEYRHPTYNETFSL